MRIMPSLAATFGLPLTILTLFLPHSLAAQTSADVGERAQGMAGAFVAVADDASAIYWNPAGLAWPTGSTFDAQIGIAGRLATDAQSGDTRLGFVGAAMPALGIAYYRTAGPISETDLPTASGSGGRQNDGSGELSPRTLATRNFGITVNHTVVNGLVVGSTVRVVRGRIDHFPARTTVDIDAGAIVSAGWVRAGLSARNLRQPEFLTDLDPASLKRQVRVGVALAPRSVSRGVHGPFSLAFDIDLTRTLGVLPASREAAVGGEYWVGEGRVGVRGGVRWNTLEEPNPALSGGVSVKLPGNLPYPLIAEGHMTKWTESGEREWGFGARITF
jgi:hypothetical protein